MGLDIGFDSVGLRPSVAVEIEEAFCETIARNRPDIRVLQADVGELRGPDLRVHAGCLSDDIDLLIGGPPCQSFCPGGKRAALCDPRGNLIFEYLRLINEIRPRYFVLENVANLVTAALRHRPIEERPGKHWNLAAYSREGGVARLFDLADNGPLPLAAEEQSGSAIRFLLDTVVAELSYSVSFGVIDAAEVGAPQKRLRFVMIGSRDGPAPRLPQVTHGPGALDYVTVKDAIGDIAGQPGPGSQYTDPVRRVFELVPPGGNWRSLPSHIAREAMGERSWTAGGGKTGFFRRLAWDEPSPTITGRANRKGSALCHPEDTRPLSVLECARLQGFPDGWELFGSMNQQYTQVGNAVPVALGAAIGNVIRSALLQEHYELEHRNEDEMLVDAIAKTRAAARNKAAR